MLYFLPVTESEANKHNSGIVCCWKVFWLGLIHVQHERCMEHGVSSIRYCKCCHIIQLAVDRSENTAHKQQVSQLILLVLSRLSSIVLNCHAAPNKAFILY